VVMSFRPTSPSPRGFGAMSPAPMAPSVAASSSSSSSINPGKAHEAAAAWEEIRRTNATTALIIGANLASVVGCVVLIKAVYGAPFHFTFANTTITIHFLLTGALMNGCALLRLFQPKRIPVRHYLQLSLAQVASVGFVNLSLYHNSVGMYQVLKFCNVPIICVMEYLWMGTSYSIEIYAALAAIIVGVTVTSVTEVSFSPLGFAFGLVGTVSTGVYQLLNKHIQQTCEVNAMQLLQYESWFTALWALLWALAGDDLTALAAYAWTPQCAALVLLGGVCAFGVNLTCYLVIGRTSPVTYGVTGHLKTIGILAFGFLMLGQPFSAKNAVGIAVAFCGVIYYTHLKLLEQRKLVEKAVGEDGGEK
jgi:solute carrier family 35 protein E3